MVLLSSFTLALELFAAKSAAAATPLLTAALQAWPVMMPLLAGHALVPALGDFSEEVLAAMSPAEVEALAVAVVVAAAWRAVPGAATWLQDTTATAIPPLASYHKCGLPCCLRVGAPAELKRCTGCRIVFFCSAACYTAAWPTHKTDCARLKDHAAAVEVVETEVPDVLK
jgi:hypothetical protein